MSTADFWETYGVLAILLLLAVAGAVSLLAIRKRPLPRDAPRPWWHFVLLWPIVLERNNPKRPAGLGQLSKREVVGWVVVLALIILAIVFEL
jgi:hypothetical protein